LARGGKTLRASLSNHLLAAAKGRFCRLKVVDVVNRNPQEAAKKSHHKRWLAAVLLHRGLEAGVKAAWHSRLDDAVSVHEEEHGVPLIRGRRVAVRVRLVVTRGNKFPRKLPTVALRSLILFSPGKRSPGRLKGPVLSRATKGRVCAR